jgi:hypothetical protein
LIVAVLYAAGAEYCQHKRVTECPYTAWRISIGAMVLG